MNPGQKFHLGKDVLSSEKEGAKLFLPGGRLLPPAPPRPVRSRALLLRRLVRHLAGEVRRRADLRAHPQEPQPLPRHRIHKGENENVEWPMWLCRNGLGAPDLCVTDK